MRDRQQMQVMIAQHGDGRAVQITHETQGLERLRAAIYQIARQPQAVARGAEVDLLE
ncbi:hypothetical protein D3C77_798780 [compost metagenome]